MHLSLKGSMDRQPLTDRLGDKLLAEYGGAAAAYSLRALNGNGDNVVRVRRASDNHEKDFTALQVSSGEMTNWVNSQIVPPLDIGVETANGRPSVPEGGTSIGTPAAAYSLRNLSTTYTGNVVEVRRSSDNAERDFTAAELADGTLEDWVNAVGVARNRTSAARWSSFTATSTGFNAATSKAGACGFDLVGSSGISIQVSFDVVINSGSFSVQLRDGFESGSSVSNSETINSSGSKSVTLTATSDFVALQFISASADVEITNFSIDVPWTYDGHVATWYDQSGNDNHATQTDNASQPKIVDAGTYLGEIDFDGDVFLQKNTTDTTTAASIFGVHTKGTSSSSAARPIGYRETNIAGTNSLAFAMDNSIRFDGAATATGTQTIPTSGLFLSTTIKVSNTEANHFLNSVSNIEDNLLTLNDTDVNFTLGFASTTPNYTYDGSISEAIFYNSDQSDNRTAIEANIGEHYGISGIPAYDNTVNGFVETWYDQSGNGSDAVQTVAANQPKIVDAGVFLGELDFDGGDFLPLSGDGLNLFRNVGYGHFFGVVTPDVTGTGTGRYFSARTGGTSARLLIGDSAVSAARTRLGARRLDSDSFDNFTANVSHNNAETLMTGFVNWADASAYLYFNGTEVGSDTNFLTAGNTEDTASTTIAIGGETSVLSSDFKAKEFIVYNSDQSANRTAIETNINHQYSIY